MKRKQWAAVVALSLILGLLCGCTVSSGVFTGMSQQSSETSLSASYVSFDGSLARRVSLKAGEAVNFSLEGGEGLQAAVKKNGEVVCEIADGTAFIADVDGNYLFALEGKAKNGAFNLTWEIS